jgi:hypothetical protein
MFNSYVKLPEGIIEMTRCFKSLAKWF